MDRPTDVVLPKDDDRGPIDEGSISIDLGICFVDSSIMVECGMGYRNYGDDFRFLAVENGF